MRTRLHFRSPLLAVLTVSLSLAACAAESEEPSLPGTSDAEDSASQSESKDFPPHARRLDVPAGTSADEALELLGGAASRGGDKAVYWTCLGGRYALQSTWNDFYVTVDLTQNARLRAKDTVLAEWEALRICIDSGTGNYAFWSIAANKYVTAEFDRSGDERGQLRARATTIQNWETFGVYRTQIGGGYEYEFYSIDPVSPYNQLLVTAEFAFTGSAFGVLRSRTLNWNSAEWERFRVISY